MPELYELGKHDGSHGPRNLDLPRQLIPRWRCGMRAAVLRLQLFMQELNGDGALTYSGGDTFDGPVPHVPGREHAGHAGLEQ